ncbi:MAG TPA: PBP1A family penicillin-binding protein [Vicinamibacterales bacterium]
MLASLVALCVASWTATGAALGYAYSAIRTLPGANAVRAAASMAHATTITDAKGRHAFTIFEEQRLQVPLSRVSPNLTRAIIAVEDRRFYDHDGVDPIRLAGALLHDVVRTRAEQGGSTITQQLARLSFLTPDKTIRRKLQELVLAGRFERAFTKDQILELYLNKAYFGDGLYGVEAASLGYFGKHAADLDVAEAALIAGLVKSPSTYAPTANVTRALARRAVVLDVMRDARVIDERMYRSAQREPLRLEDSLRRDEAYGQYFKEEVRKQLVDIFGWERVYRSGLRVETTLDLDMQRAAEAEVARAIADIERRQTRRASASSPETALQAALVAIDPRTGEVRAMVGGRDFRGSPFNRATQSKRQPGSAFKPVVYAAALEQGYTPATILSGLNAPATLSQAAWLPDDEHVADEAMTMRAALRVSSNRAAVRMLQTIGIPSAVDYAERLGLGRMPSVPSLAIGTGEVTLLSLTSAFGAFGNAGMLARPALIRRVTSSDGQVLYEPPAASTRAVSPTTAFLITSMLEDVIDTGTAAQARTLGFRLPAAGKTGTTNDYRDAWFVGYTSRLVTGVWVGYDQPRTIIRGGYAAQLAVPLWARFMTSATHDDKPEWFRPPSGVITVAIDAASGRLANGECRRAPDAEVRTEYFVQGTEPIDVCPIHRSSFLRALIFPSLRTPDELPRQVASAPEEPAEPAVQRIDPPAPNRAEEPSAKKKRGFWSRVLGIGRNADRTNDKTPR